jgi:hypothetical protein
MTPTQEWIFCLALVYAAPSFLAGVGITLLVVRWRARRAKTLAPKPAPERDGFIPLSLASADDSPSLSDRIGAC